MLMTLALRGHRLRSSWHTVLASCGSSNPRDLSGKLPLQITYLQVMTLDLTDAEAAALTQELHNIFESDRYPFSPRIRTLRAILAKLRPEPVREPLPPPKVYAPRAKRRRG
jgi:hypothetical protein